MIVSDVSSHLFLVHHSPPYVSPSLSPSPPSGAKIIQMHGGRDCTGAFLDVHSESYLTQFLDDKSFIGVVKGSKADKPKKKVRTGERTAKSRHGMAYLKGL